jgi:HEAT repeat protein
MIRFELSVAAWLVGAYFLFLTTMFALQRTRAAARRRRTVTPGMETQQIRDALVDYLAGSNDQTRIREFVRANRGSVADVVLEFQGTVAGTALDRLLDLALELALVHDWCRDAASKEQSVRREAYARLSFVCAYEPCRRVAGDLLEEALSDADPEVRLSGARALAQSGSTEDLAKVFRLAVSQSPLTRVLLAADLRRHAAALCARAVPEVLAAGNTPQTVAALQILAGWERALPLNDLHKLLESEVREVRLEALRLVPLVPLSPENRSALLRALREGDEDENTVAAITAGRLKLQEALPSLARCLRTGTAELAGIAAAALADMPPKGWETLREFAGGATSSTFIATTALEHALRKARV